MRVLDLFSGIGGFSLGLERAGMTTVGFCEIDPFCREVLRKHWPEVWIHDDVRTLTTPLIRERCGHVDLIAGGFPCQDLSAAGKGAGLDGERSGLWWELCGIISRLRPAWLLIENVPALRTRGADRVLACLEGIGYSVWPLVVGAWAVGAPHKRDRVWIVGRLADTDIGGRGQHKSRGSTEERITVGRAGSQLDHAAIARGLGTNLKPVSTQYKSMFGLSDVADASRHGERHELARERADGQRTGAGCDEKLADAEQQQSGERHIAAMQRRRADDTEQVGMGSVNGSGELADPQGFGQPSWAGLWPDGESRRRRELEGGNQQLADPASRGQRADGGTFGDAGHVDECGTINGVGLADSECPRLEGFGSDAGQPQIAESGDTGAHRWPARPGERQYEWEAPRLLELPLGGELDGVPVRLVRRANKCALKAYGNAVVPQVVEAIGRAIMEATR